MKRSHKRLTFDEKKICERMKKMYGEDEDAMFRDIKVNYLQWSRGEVRAKMKIYSKERLA